MAKSIPDPSLTFSRSTYKALPNATSSQESAAGLMRCALQDGRIADLFGLEAAPANPSPSQVKDEAWTIHGIYGPTSTASSPPADPLSSWENRLRQRLASLGSTECVLTWKESVTPAGRRLSRLVPSMRPIEEIDFGLWQTPVADDAMNRAKGKINSRGEPKLSGQVMSLWHTPTCHMAREGGLPGGVHEEHAHHDGGSLHGAWADSLWLAGADGKARRVKSGVRLLANGVPARVGKLRAYGNAIVPPLAAEVIKALM